MNDRDAVSRRGLCQNYNFPLFLHSIPFPHVLFPPLFLLSPLSFCFLFLPFYPPPPHPPNLPPFSSPISLPPLLSTSISLLSSPAAVQRSPPRPPSGCQVTGTEAVTSPPPRPTVSPPPLPWQRRQRPAEPRLAKKHLQEKEEERKQENA